jgi:hypothetical protein
MFRVDRPQLIAVLGICGGGGRLDPGHHGNIQQETHHQASPHATRYLALVTSVAWLHSDRRYNH